ncbi:hypothetical protein BH11BAC5_BH11BAC5_13300 [soil metagenome]
MDEHGFNKSANQLKTGSSKDDRIVSPIIYDHRLLLSNSHQDPENTPA